MNNYNDEYNLTCGLKSLHYCYPSSENAHKYNEDKGCWLVYNHGVTETQNPCVFQEDDKHEALTFFEKCSGIDWTGSFTRFNETFWTPETTNYNDSAKTYEW